MSVVTLAQASTIVDTALKKGREINCAPLTIAVLDAGGHLVAFKREDKSGLLRFDIAFGKAWGALGMGFGSRTLAARAAKTPMFFTALAAASGGRMVTNPGGVLIRTAVGDIIGVMPSVQSIFSSLNTWIMLMSMKSTPSFAPATPAFFISCLIALVNFFTCDSDAGPAAPLIQA